jgi:hypothetical protein
MSEFDPTDHPRSADGTFAAKPPTATTADVDVLRDSTVDAVAEPPPIPPREMAVRIHRAPSRLFTQLLVNVNQSDMDEIRRAWATWVSTSRRPFVDWRDAWDAYVHESGGSMISYRTARCPDRHGKGFDVKFHARTGSPVCPECHGSRRGKRVTVRARLAGDDKTLARVTL